MRIVDDRRLDGLAEHDEELPTILLVGAAAPERSCPQLLGRVRRRGRLADLYPLLQRHLEPCPRTVPRVVDALPARATAGHESWAGAITSISEGGCLFRSSAPLGNGGRLQVCFPLSRHGLVQLPARPSYESPEGYGLVFDPVSPETREALADYVHGRLGA